MRIMQLEAENVKRLRAVNVRIDPDTNMLVVGGDNGQGKTSLLDSIMYALGGSKGIPSDPIRHGQKRAVVKLDLGQYQVERRFTAGGSTLTVTANGAEIGSPQGILDKLYARLAFDPLAFCGMKPADQLDTLRKLSGVDVTALDAEHERVYRERADVNREIKRIEGALKSTPFHANVPESEVDTALIRRRLQEATAARVAYDEMVRTRAEAMQERDRLQRLLDEVCTSIKEYDRCIADTPTPEDPSPLWAQIATADSVNAKVRDMRRWLALEAEQTAQEKRAQAMSDRLAEIADGRQELIGSAKLPVPGLGFGSGCVTYNGVPFDQCSGAEQLRVSTAMALASNPELRVCLIRGGPLLDKKSLALMEQLANEFDFQIVMERVGDGAECSLIISDGVVSETRDGVEAIVAETA